MDKWEAISYFEKPLSDKKLSEEDLCEIKRLQIAIKKSEDLKGYCPFDRQAVIDEYRKTLDTKKYRLETVFEHYGLGYCALLRKVDDSERKCKCPNGGDEADDCADCAYSPDYHFVDGECVKRKQ